MLTRTGSRPPEAPPDARGEVAVRAAAKSFGEVEVFRSLDLAIAPREVLGLVGPSGCGKSTLLELIAGLREPDRGAISVEGASDAPGRLARCAYMPQRDLLLPWYGALDNASLALRNQGMGRRQAREAAAGIFARLGLAGFEDSAPGELSGGMRQRVAFARTVLAGKPVLLLDEPFASLDAITRAEMQGWLGAALSAEPRTILLVSHDVEEALYLCDRVAVLSARPGRVVAELRAPAPRARDRDAAVTDPAFAAVREEALVALREGSR
jgi:ABC-type nitrate/sulfonate/bicarbonate transport system ATPase subunit